MDKPTLLTARFPLYLLRDQGALALMLWVAISLFAFGLTFAVWLWQGDIEVSGWDRVVEVVRWYLFVIGIHLGWQTLELHVSHGQTRRNFVIQMLGFIPAFTALLAVLTLITFGIEALIYLAMGWPQATQSTQLYANVGQVHLVLAQHWLVFTLWMVGGFLISAAWYRTTALGVCATVLAVVASALSGLAVGTGWGPFGYVFAQLTGWDAVPVWLSVALHLGLIAGLFGLSWRAIAGVDLRPVTQ